MTKLLITGSCGFIAGSLIRKLVYESNRDRIKYPFSIASVDRMTGSGNTAYSNKNNSFHIADIRDQHVMDRIFQFEQPDIVVHMAAETAVDASISDPNSFITSNVLGTQVIINSCVKHKVSRLIMISSDEVYGQLTSDTDQPWTEESPLNPRNPYAASKACGELLVKAAYQTYGLTYNITRSSNNYGPRQTPDKLIPKVIKSILQDNPIPIYGQGLQLRDWTHVFDNCSALLKIITHGKPNETYNISANQELTNIEVVQKICNSMGKGHTLINHINDPRPGHDFRYAVNCDKIKTLGWKPTYKFADGITDTVEWYKLNPYILT
jgi:dTDP-glucose 4,6-dehydratase